MSPVRVIRFSAVTLAVLLATTACGLKPSMKDSLGTLAGPAGPVGGDNATVTAPDGTTTVTQPDGTTTVVGPSGPIVSGPNTGPQQPGGQPQQPGGQPQQSGQPRQPGGQPPPNQPPSGGGTRIGVTKDTIRIGVHAPISGAAPLPQESFKTGVDLWWKNHLVFGRKVVTEVMDDHYKPSVARQACEAMAGRNFILFGGAGTDQIQACATDPVLRRGRVPYMSAGVTEVGIRGLPDYFALSMSYKQQGTTVVKNAKMQNFPSGQWGLVLSDTPNFDDALSGISNALKAAGISYKVYRTPKYTSSSDEAQIAQQLAGARHPVVYFLTAPTFFLGAVRNAHGQLYDPVWTGVGVSMGLNTVVQVACGSTQNQFKASFLSPFPGLDRAPKDFWDAGGKDDIHLSLYGSSQLIYEMLMQTGGDLTRENVISTLERSTLDKGNVFPPLKFSPNDHFGGTAAWSLKANCSKRAPDNKPGVWDTAFANPIS